MTKNQANTSRPSGGQQKKGGNTSTGQPQQEPGETSPELGLLGSLLPPIEPGYFKKLLTVTPDSRTPVPPQEVKAPPLFFKNDPRMGWLPEYIIGDTERVVSRVDIFLKGNQLPKGFTVDDLLALVRRGARGMCQAWFTPKAIFEAAQGKRANKRPQEIDGIRKKPGPSADVQKLRCKLFDARKKAEAKTGPHRAECWETWIPRFKNKLRPQSLLDVDVKLQHPYPDPVKACDLDVEGWKRLYKQEYAERKKWVGN